MNIEQVFQLPFFQNLLTLTITVIIITITGVISVMFSKFIFNTANNILAGMELRGLRAYRIGGTVDINGRLCTIRKVGLVKTELVWDSEMGNKTLIDDNSMIANQQIWDIESNTLLELQKEVYTLRDEIYKLKG